MKKVILTTSIILSLTIVGCKKTEVTPETGELAPSFTLNDVSDKPYKIDDYRGKVVVLFFFGNTCPSCIGTAPKIQSTFASDNSSNVIVLGLDQWDGEKSSLVNFQKTTGVQFPLLLKASSVADTYKTVYDRIIVIDKNGYIRFRGSQVATNDIDAAKKVVTEYSK